MVTQAPEQSGERETLLAYLARQRDLVQWKLAGLSDEDARSVATSTGLTVHVLVRHLTGVEHGWLQETFAGRPRVRDRDREFTGRDDGTPLAELLDAYRDQCALSDAVVAPASLDDPAARTGQSLRWVLLHLVEETARHLGHLDLLCELADGRVGDQP